jgi:hypothetical protein
MKMTSALALVSAYGGYRVFTTYTRSLPQGSDIVTWLEELLTFQTHMS